VSCVKKTNSELGLGLYYFSFKLNSETILVTNKIEVTVLSMTKFHHINKPLRPMVPPKEASLHQLPIAIGKRNPTCHLPRHRHLKTLQCN